MATPRFFCKTCGVHVYGTGDMPELGGAFVSINMQTLDSARHLSEGGSTA